VKRSLSEPKRGREGQRERRTEVYTKNTGGLTAEEQKNDNLGKPTSPFLIPPVKLEDRMGILDLVLMCIYGDGLKGRKIQLREWQENKSSKEGL